MNLHFLSFLMDIASWLVFGYIYGRYIQRVQGFENKSDKIVSLKITLISLLGGLIAVAHRALPSYGFAFYHFSVAMLFAFVYSLRYFAQFKKYVVRLTTNHINSLAKLTPFPLTKRATVE